MNLRYKSYSTEQLLNAAISNVSALPDAPEFSASKHVRYSIVEIRAFALEQLQELQARLAAAKGEPK